jgi:hypothetical protein
VTETAGARLSVVVLARPGAGAGAEAGAGTGEDLLDALGGARADALVQLQFARARDWATATFPAEAVQLRSGGLTDVISGLDWIGPDDLLVVVTPELGAWRADIGHAALEDLRAGCALSIGPIFDGGLYLLATTGAGLELLRGGGGADAAGDGVDLTGPSAMAALVGIAERAGIEVGLLQTERGLRSAGDVRALLADPLCDEELRKLLNADWGEGT